MGVARRLIPPTALLAFALAVTAACGPPLRAAVSVGFHARGKVPPDASVTIDEEYIGPYAYVAAHGVRLPVGQHRITIERDGYFPFDALIVGGRYPVKVEVELVRIPD